MPVLQVGAGSVGWVIAHKLAQNNDVFGDIVVASRTRSKCEKIVASIERKNHRKELGNSVIAREVDADDVDRLRSLIEEVQPELVISATPPWTNNPNLLEIQGDSFYWEDSQWKVVPSHSRMMEVDLPEVGRHKVYSMAHDEARSLMEFIPARHIEFWMGFSDNYLRYFNALRDVGMLSPEPVTTAEGIIVSPLKVLKAVLPEPVSLAPN